MRNLRLYMTDIEFKTYEEFCGGDGLTTESIVPGVSMSKDIRKRYFNPHDETILTHTLTINYKDIVGNNVAEPTTMSIKYFQGVTSETVVTPKNIDGYTTSETSKTVSIPEDSSVDFVYTNKEYYLQPLTFEILSDGVLTWRDLSSPYDAIIKYSKDNGNTWSSFTPSYGGTKIDVFSGETILVKGDNPSFKNIRLAGSTCQYNVKGNIMSIIKSSGFENVETFSSTCNFQYLFAYSSGLVSAKDLILPATKLLGSQCYSYMFDSCTSITEAPLILPATELSDYCYNGMFRGCTSLVTAPILPAKTLTNSCYSSMFSGCTSLVVAPELPATTIAIYCYRYMFADCVSLSGAPSILPATTLETFCYDSMFSRCSSLVTAPELPAIKLANYCYNYMFNGCSSLNYVKAMFTTLPSTSCTNVWLQRVASSGTFIKNANAIWTGEGASYVPSGWNIIKTMAFGRDCISVSSLTQTVTFNIDSVSPWTAKTIPYWITLSQNTGNSGNTTITVTQSSFEEGRDGEIVFAIDGCPDVPFLFRQLDFYHRTPLSFEITRGGSFRWTYGQGGSGNRTVIEYSKDSGETWTEISANNQPSVLVDSGETIQFRGNNETLSIYSLSATFSGSSCGFNVYGNIMSILDKTNYAERTVLTEGSIFRNLFNGCRGLQSAQNLILPATVLSFGCYKSLFGECDSLTAAPELPAMLLSDECYANMFTNCTGLTTAPELKPEILSKGCYYNMFDGCASLNHVECLATDISASACTYQWLRSVSDTGVFEKHPNMTGWTSGTSGIPTGWTVQDVTI